MSTSEISVAVTGELATLVRDAVDSGEYPTHEDVVRAALKEWSGNRVEIDVAHLKRCWDEAMLDSGTSVNPDQVFRELRAKYGFDRTELDTH